MSFQTYHILSLPFLNLDSEYREVLLDANILRPQYFEPRYIYYWYSSKVKSRFTIQAAVYSLGERCLKISKADIPIFFPFYFSLIQRVQIKGRLRRINFLITKMFFSLVMILDSSFAARNHKSFAPWTRAQFLNYQLETSSRFSRVSSTRCSRTQGSGTRLIQGKSWIPLMGILSPPPPLGC